MDALGTHTSVRKLRAGGASEEPGRRQSSGGNARHVPPK